MDESMPVAAAVALLLARHNVDDPAELAKLRASFPALRKATDGDIWRAKALLDLVETAMVLDDAKLWRRLRTVHDLVMDRGTKAERVRLADKMVDNALVWLYRDDGMLPGGKVRVDLASDLRRQLIAVDERFADLNVKTIRKLLNGALPAYAVRDKGGRHRIGPTNVLAALAASVGAFDERNAKMALRRFRSIVSKGLPKK